MVATWLLFGLLLVAVILLDPPLSHDRPLLRSPNPSTGQAPPVMAPMPRVSRGWRVFIFYSCALLLTGLVSMLFADLLWRTGWSPSGIVLLCLFVDAVSAHRGRLHARGFRFCAAAGPTTGASPA